MITITRIVSYLELQDGFALMIQLGIVLGGGVGRVGNKPTTYIQLTCSWINININNKKLHQEPFFVND